MSEQTPVTEALGQVCDAVERFLRQQRTSLMGDLGLLDSAVSIGRAALRAAPQPDLAALRAAVEALRLTGADYATRYGHGYNDALAGVLRLLSDAIEPVAGGSREPETQSACDEWDWDGPYRFRCGRRLDADGKCQRHWARRATPESPE